SNGPEPFELVHLAKLEHAKNAVLVRDQRIDLAGLIRHLVLHLRVQVKSVLQNLVQVQIRFENVLPRIEAQVVRVLLDDVLKDVAVRGVADDADVAALEAQNLFSVALIFFTELRAAESSERISRDHSLAGFLYNNQR